MGRPPLPSSAKKNNVVTIRLTDQEHTHLDKKYGGAVKGLRYLVRMDLGKRQTSDETEDKGGTE